MFSRIKAYLRSNYLYIRFFQCRINSIRYWIKNLVFYIVFFRFSSSKKTTGHTLYFVFDHKQKHPGLADRLKVICCAYYIAKIDGFDFKLVFDTSFYFSNYLEFNIVDWSGNISDLNFSFISSRMLAYNGMGKIPKLNKKYNQYIVYYYIGKNILQYNAIEKWEDVWADCFHELFKPTPILKNAIDESRYAVKSYIAVHLRFVNALENFEDGYYNMLAIEAQKALIQKCLVCLKNIQKNNKLPLLIFSDSNRFLSIVKEYGYSVLDGNVNHVSFHTDEDTMLKTFTDFYMISRSAKVYRIISKEMYATTFSYYAAISGRCEFETIYI